MRREAQTWIARLDRAIWEIPPAERSGWRANGLRAVQIAAVVLRDVTRGELTLWSMSLVYTTLLSIVPLLALCFSVLKAFGVHNQIEPLLSNLLQPLGDQGHEVTMRLVGFIERMNVGVLGTVGLGMLVYTVVSLMQKIEASFNAVWHVTQLRSFGERFTRYLSALLIGPLLVFVALGVTATALHSATMQSLLNVEVLGHVVRAATRLVPYLLVIGAFTFMYVFIPNTKVRPGAAAIAGVVGGVLWQSAGWAFAAFVAGSTQYSAIYSSFAILVLFLIWLYVSWLVMLVGVSVSFYVQHPEYVHAAPGEPRLSNRLRERIALAAAELIARRFDAGETPWTLPELTRALRLPMHPVGEVLCSLEEGGLLARTLDEPPGWLPARDPDAVTLADVLACVRSAGEDRFLNAGVLALSPAARDAAARLDAALDASLRTVSLKQYVRGGLPGPATAAPSTQAASPQGPSTQAPSTQAPST